MLLLPTREHSAEVDRQTHPLGLARSVYVAEQGPFGQSENMPHHTPCRGQASPGGLKKPYPHGKNSFLWVDSAFQENIPVTSERTEALWWAAGG